MVSLGLIIQQFQSTPPSPKVLSSPECRASRNATSTCPWSGPRLCSFVFTDGSWSKHIWFVVRIILAICVSRKRLSLRKRRKLGHVCCTKVNACCYQETMHVHDVLPLDANTSAGMAGASTLTAFSKVTLTKPPCAYTCFSAGFPP